MSVRTITALVIKQGDSLDLTHGVEGVTDLTGWSCKVQVKSALSDQTPVFEETVTDLNDDDDRFVQLIPRNETDGWEVGDYFLISDIWNTTSGRSRENQLRLRVEARGVENA